MSTTKAILQEVQAVLKADATLAAYAGDRVYIGTRRNVSDTQFPIIFLEPDAIDERYEAFPSVDASLRVVIGAYTRNMDIEAQHLGDAQTKGILELEKDIKAAFGAHHPTLNNQVLEFTFPRTEFGVREDLASSPVRAVVIEMELHYRTTLSART